MRINSMIVYYDNHPPQQKQQQKLTLQILQPINLYPGIHTCTLYSCSCVHCKQPRSKDPKHIYCTHCGSRFPPLPKTSPKPPLQMAVCSNCHAHLSLNSTKCVVCEGTVLKPLPIPTITGQVDDIHQCKVHVTLCN